MVNKTVRLCQVTGLPQISNQENIEIECKHSKWNYNTVLITQETQKYGIVSKICFLH